MEISPLGDSALIIQLGELSKNSLDEVLELAGRLKRAQIPGVIELAPAYTSVAVFFNPLHVMASGAEADSVFDWLEERIRLAFADEDVATRTRPTLVEIPVCYEEKFAIDLDDVASHAGLSPRDVVDLHFRGEYRVSCLGFTPGFPFLSGLPDQLATPRRSIPRKEVPAGSVAIGGRQTGIYPIRSPGGWNVIGRTPLRLFDPNKVPPTLLHPGDRVRFRSITLDEFEAWS